MEVHILDWFRRVEVFYTVTYSKKPPDRHEVMSRSGAYSSCEINMHNTDTVLDKAPGQEAFSTLVRVWEISFEK